VKEKGKSSGRVLLIPFKEVVLVFKSSFVPFLVRAIESALKTDRLAVVSCVRKMDPGDPRGVLK
jgi:hypothetical protein